jgi:hypothetical protein
MALPWVRMDTQWPHNPKFLILVEEKKWRSITVYWAAVGWSGAQGQNGFIPAYALPMIHGTKKEAAELTEVGLWDMAQGGWDIHDWSEYQPSTEEHEKRSQRARAAAQKRWGTQT